MLNLQEKNGMLYIGLQVISCRKKALARAFFIDC